MSHGSSTYWPIAAVISSLRDGDDDGDDGDGDAEVDTGSDMEWMDGCGLWDLADCQINFYIYIDFM